MSYPNFSPVDEFAFTHGLDMDHNLAPTHCLGDISMSFDSTFFSESTRVSYTSDFPMDYQESAGLMPDDSREETPQPGGILAPIVADYVLAPATDKPFDGEISTQDTYLKDVKRYMDKHGKAPPLNAFIQESSTVLGRRRRGSAKAKNVSSSIPTTPDRKQVAPLPTRVSARQAFARSSVLSDTPDPTPKRTPRQKKGVAFKG